MDRTESQINLERLISVAQEHGGIPVFRVDGDDQNLVGGGVLRVKQNEGGMGMTIDWLDNVGGMDERLRLILRTEDLQRAIADAA